MGCDIHDVVQVKQPDGTWKTVAKDIYPGRNYNLFGLLAGVRGNVYEPIDEPRGLPDDFEVLESNGLYSCDVIHESHWMGEFSFSWLTVYELAIAATEQEDEEAFDMLTDLIQLIGSHIENASDRKAVDVRYVFGFDS